MLALYNAMPPAEYSEIESKIQFYQCLNETRKNITRRDIIIILGNMNAKVGTEGDGIEQIMGTHGLSNI